ncbi:hypothetical protein KVT40_002345 [Elsinoe batatas]|uniref:Myb-like domain-containing protein n=1 Tax=Elsinoe batatas TaxID=2601811 RepID=A0A8K0LAC3_9PEZI|nr:hypothetical protein KVT40_002345 [Elsinoe batatas]
MAPWTPEEERILLLTLAATGATDKDTFAKAAERIPGKTVGAARQYFDKIRKAFEAENSFTDDGEGKPAPKTGAKGGRKRKSDAVDEPGDDDETKAAPAKKGKTTAAKGKGGKKAAGKQAKAEEMVEASAEDEGADADEEMTNTETADTSAVETPGIKPKKGAAKKKAPAKSAKKVSEEDDGDAAGEYVEGEKKKTLVKSKRGTQVKQEEEDEDAAPDYVEEETKTTPKRKSSGKKVKEEGDEVDAAGDLKDTAEKEDATATVNDFGATKGAAAFDDADPLGGGPETPGKHQHDHTEDAGKIIVETTEEVETTFNANPDTPGKLGAEVEVEHTQWVEKMEKAVTPGAQNTDVAE